MAIFKIRNYISNSLRLQETTKSIREVWFVCQISREFAKVKLFGSWNEPRRRSHQGPNSTIRAWLTLGFVQTWCHEDRIMVDSCLPIANRIHIWHSTFLGNHSAEGDNHFCVPYEEHKTIILSYFENKQDKINSVGTVLRCFARLIDL